MYARGVAADATVAIVFAAVAVGCATTAVRLLARPPPAKLNPRASATGVRIAEADHATRLLHQSAPADTSAPMRTGLCSVPWTVAVKPNSSRSPTRVQAPTSSAWPGWPRGYPRWRRLAALRRRDHRRQTDPLQEAVIARIVTQRVVRRRYPQP